MPFSAYIMLRFKGWTSELFPSYHGSQVLRFHSFCNASALSIYTEWSNGCVGGGSNQMKVERMLINFQTIAYMTSYPGLLAISWLPNTLQTPVWPTAKTSARITSLKTVTDALVLISMTSSRPVDWWRGKTCSGWTNIIDLHPCTVFLLDDARFKVYIKSLYDHDDIVTVLNKIIHFLQTLQISFICLVFIIVGFIANIKCLHWYVVKETVTNSNTYH